MTRRLSLFILAMLFASSAASAEPPKAPDPAAILAQATSAAARLQAIGYEAAFSAEGALQKRIPRMTGQVIAKKAANGAEHPFWVSGTAVNPRDGTSAEFMVACDGERVVSVDHRLKVFTTGPLSEIKRPLNHPLFQPRYLHDAPFDQEILGSKLSYLGVEEVAGVPCDVILAEANAPPFNKQKLFIGKEDALLRRCHTTIEFKTSAGGGGMHGSVTFSVKNLTTKPEISKDLFHQQCPDGYEIKPIEAPKPQQRNASGLISVGQAAPNWELKTADGKMITLESLRGNVVVLDFWATWCGPCRMAMPGLQKLHEHFKDKPVKVLGVNCRERNRKANPATFAKSQGLTYTQLLNGNAVASAYGVRGIPCLFVIGKDGKVLRAVAGFNPMMEVEIGALIEKQLAQQKKTP